MLPLEWWQLHPTCDLNFLPRYPKWGCTDKSDPSLPGLCRSGANKTSKHPFPELVPAFPSGSGFFRVLGTPAPKCMEQVPFFSPRAIAQPCPSLCICQGRTGAWPALGRSCRADGRQARSHPAKGPRESHGEKLLFCCLELLFQVSRASVGLWEQEQ